MLQQITNWGAWAIPDWIQMCRAMCDKTRHVEYHFEFDASRCSDEDKFMLAQLIFCNHLGPISLNRFSFTKDSILDTFVIAQVGDCINISESLYSQMEELTANQEGHMPQNRIIVQDEDHALDSEASSYKRTERLPLNGALLVKNIHRVLRISASDGENVIECVDLDGIFRNSAPAYGSKIALFPGLERQRDILLLRAKYVFHLGGRACRDSSAADKFTFLSNKLKGR
ncbi:hypothetical protein DI09_97p40 [Mitosporidium daphniae]|uniref:RecQ mediated genome instability protein 1 OB-fold domain-containing protein n=1 Tax=Mitosporidium daphniae TaxID=1485682 RepID=A0A098VQJ1_9MICR|nr:uncharacterized protein DI09_97p40 [Mitosporidium daphniae]KGG49981.1 hypothetical protein DI09_97p40 [Mitosporidium daphniae]|eukprot:XP_013236417.1 uncharacterized protein DI09_97p40 [Mitosporidium daphniae]